MTNTIYSTKSCFKCKTQKPISNFGKNKSKSDGLQTYCNQCRQEYRRRNKETQKQFNQNYYDKNKEQVCKVASVYYHNNKVKVREYRKRNKNKIKQYRVDNREKSKQYMKERRRNNPHVRLHDSISTSIGETIKKCKTTSKYLKMFGYTMEELMFHLESKFVDNMNWNNYGKYGWHIDHIKPKSWFDCSDEKQLIECWSLSNLQPLWAKDNWSKGDRFIG